MNNEQPQQGTSQQAANTGGQQEDYLDKGLDALERKFGGGKVDPVKQRETNEKVTDKARDFAEKKFGFHVPGKFSN